MRRMRWLIPMFVLILGSLACFATAEDEDDSSVPMTRQTGTVIDLTGGVMMSTDIPTPGPSPTPFPTTDSSMFLPDVATPKPDKAEGISAVVPLVGIMGLAFGGFVGVIWYKGRHAAMRHRKSG